MRVGALPTFPNNALKYNLTWSTDGLINEYCNPCEAIVDGELRETAALEEIEHFSLDGIDYEDSILPVVWELCAKAWKEKSRT
jgi:saccharopine dehydrogenase-like NADP-dependent oxidoreductase